jgi:hypothetical protein
MTTTSDLLRPGDRRHDGRARERSVEDTRWRFDALAVKPDAGRASATRPPRSRRRRGPDSAASSAFELFEAVFKLFG